MIVSAVAQLERDRIRDRVRAGLRNARAKGKKFEHSLPRFVKEAGRIYENPSLYEESITYKHFYLYRIDKTWHFIPQHLEKPP
jgi:DNA invertase Pin-like site-specific DNA recombinase